MATIKHLTSKNSNYAAAESYLTFQHNEYTGLPILDEKGSGIRTCSTPLSAANPRSLWPA